MIRLTIFALVLLALSPRVAPDTPPITEPATDGLVLNPADVHMQAGPFSNAGGATHASTDWEIWKVSTNQIVWSAIGVTDAFTKVHIHLADGAFVNAYAGRTTLEFDTNYRLQVRFTNNLAETSANGIRLFTTSPAGPAGVPGPIPWVPFQAGYKIEVVASGFKLPVNIAFVPNPGPNPTDPFFYVTELYGNIKVVQRNGAVSLYAQNLLNYDPTALGSFPGAGEQGLTGLCVDPVSGDLFATCLQQVSPSERNPKVIRLHSGDGGMSGSIINTLLMSGESQGQSHQISNCSIGPDGKLYVHNGDGFDASKAQNLDSFRGKILRMNLDLTAPSDNPHYSDPGATTARKYVWAYGVRNPFGGAWRASDGNHYEVENGPGQDRFARIIANRNLSWDTAATDAMMTAFALYNWSPAHAPVNVAFIQPETFAGSGFPGGKMDRAFVSESGPTHAAGPQPLGKRIVEFQMNSGDTAVGAPSTLAEYNGTGFGTCVAMAAGPDGLYFSDLYKDQNPTTPADGGGQILRVRYIGVPPDGAGVGFDAEYFPSKDLTGVSVKQTDPTINFSWPATTSPAAGIPGDGFSVRWRGQILPRTTDSYTFTTTSDDGVRLWVNGTLLVDNWTDHATTDNSGSINLVAGQKVDIVMEYYDNVGDAVAKLSWSGPSQPTEVVPSSQIYAPAPAVSSSSSTGGGGGGGSCGLLGLELALPGLGALLRRRRRNQ